MSSQFKNLHADKSKGKSFERTQYLLRSWSIWSLSTGQSRKQWPEQYMTYLKACLSVWQISHWLAGVKQDTLTALRTAPIHLHSLFPDNLLIKAEEEVSRSEERRSAGQSHRKPGRFHPYASNDKSSHQPDRKPSVPAWKQIRERQQGKKGHGKPSTFSQKPAKGSKPRK